MRKLLNIDSYIFEYNTKIEIHYQKIGEDKFPVFLLTGYGMTSNFWPSDFINGLSETYTVYLIDYPSILSKCSVAKLSMQEITDSLLGLIESFSYSLVDLIGWSMGACFSLSLVMAKPKLFRKLVLLAPVLPKIYPVTESTDALEFRAKSVEDLVNKIFISNLYNYNSADFDYFYNKRLASNQSIFASRKSNLMLLSALLAWKQDEINYENYTNLQIPILFLMPEFENILDVKISNLAISQYKFNKEVHVIPNSGHAPFYQKAEQINNLIKSFNLE